MKKNTVKSIVERNGNLVVRFFDNTGSLKQKSLGLSATKSNRNRVWKEIVPAFEDGLRKQAEESTKVKIPLNFGFYADKYHQQLIDISHSKLIGHKYRIEALTKHFGANTVMADVSELEIEEFFQKLKCKRTTKLDWLLVLRAIFEKARKGKALDKNVVSQFKLPLEPSNTDENAIMPFEPDEIKRLLTHSKGTVLHNFLVLSLYLGTRGEETIGLQIKDIDFDQNIVRIERAITKGQIKAPKTKGSRRSIPLPLQARRYFEEQIKESRRKKSLFLFSRDDGSPLLDIAEIRGKKNRDGNWVSLLQDAKVPYRKLMQTRHTFAVNAIKSGEFSLQEIASILGHTSLSMLFHHYGKHLGTSHLKVSRSIDIFGLGDILGDTGQKIGLKVGA
jgi:integrase